MTHILLEPQRSSRMSSLNCRGNQPLSMMRREIVVIAPLNDKDWHGRESRHGIGRVKWLDDRSIWRIFCWPCVIANPHPQPFLNDGSTQRGPPQQMENLSFECSAVPPMRYPTDADNSIRHMLDCQSLVMKRIVSNLAQRSMAKNA
jgi:hypothetical protein